MPLGVNLESIKLSERRTIHPEVSRAERLLCAAEYIDGNFGSAELGEQVGKGMEDYGGDFELSRELDDLSTGTAGDAFWSTFITPFDAAQHQQRFVHPRHWVSVLFIDVRAALRRNRTAETVDVHATLRCSNA